MITSCNAVKRIEDNNYLLQKNTIYKNGKKTKNIELYSYLRQRPNQKVLGVPFSLYWYNQSNPNFEKTFEQWVENHPKKSRFFSSTFSNKQVKAIYRVNKGINNSFKKNGDAPVILDWLKTKKSIKSLTSYFNNKGYFDVVISSKEALKSEKRKTVSYFIETKTPYFLDTIHTNISSPSLARLYELNKFKSVIKKGQQYDYNKLKLEQKRLTTLFRNSGVYNFGKDYIGFDVDMRDTTTYHKKVFLRIADQIVEYGDSITTKPFKIQKVKQINIYTDYSFNTKDEPYLDSIYYKGYTFWAHKKIKFNPKYLANVIAISPNEIYKDNERKTTKQYLNDLKIFRSPIILDYIETSDESLDVNINLTPLKKYGIDTNLEATHSNIKPFGILGKFAFIDRNIFKGAEIFELSFQGSFLNLAEDASSDDFNFFGFTAWEMGATSSLKIPRIFFPINTSKIIPKHMQPKTAISLSMSLQKNIGLDRQNITGSLSYLWRKNKKTNHQFDLLNVQYINNLNTGSYFDIFGSEKIKLEGVAQTIIDPDTVNSDGKIIDPFGYIDFVLNPINGFENTNPSDFLTVERVKERRNIITEDILVPVASYTYTYNSKETIKDNSFSFFRGKLISAGSVTNLFAKKNELGRVELFGLPVAQYLKAEFEYKKYWDIGRAQNLVFRTFVGAAVPFGNSSEIPFSRSYRAGGSNDIRAWRTFDLGPGSSKSNLEFNTGNLKIISNFEYRFKIINSLHSAIFVDAGNVWDLTNSDLTNDEAKFKNVSSIQNIAIGSGLGLRYDFSFLVFRVDLGFKTYEPYLSKNKWFRNYNFKNEVVNFGINYPF